MPQMPSNIVATAAEEAHAPAWCEEVLVGSFRAIGRQFGPVVTIGLENRMVSAKEADEIDELSGFDLIISRLQILGSKYFVFNISKVTQIDHVALRHFLGAKSILERGGGRVVLTGSPSSDDTLLSHLLTLLPHFSSPDAALRYLQGDEYLSATPDKERQARDACMTARRLETGDGLGSAQGRSIDVVTSNASGTAGVGAQSLTNVGSDDTNSRGPICA